MARAEILVVLKELLERYEFTMGWDGEEREPRRSLTLPMLGGLPVRVKEVGRTDTLVLHKCMFCKHRDFGDLVL